VLQCVLSTFTLRVHTMALVRTNITIPQETLELIDAVAGPRGRSAYISEVLARQARRDNAIKVVRETAGALKGSTSWGRTPEEIDQTLRDLRDSSGRDRMLYGDDW
jgi:hypothetical protein